MESVPRPSEIPSDRRLDENAECFQPRAETDRALDQAHFRSKIEELALELGLLRIGFAKAAPFLEAGQRFKDWLGRGHAGTMSYLAELGERHLPGRFLVNARSLVVVAAAVPASAEPADSSPEGQRDILGKVADYALGLDYHIALRSRLRRIGQGLADWSGRAVWTRACIDTAPILEREAARCAGLGFIGKSTMLIVPGVGPRVLLATLVTDLALTPDTPIESRCGRCTACLDACPTQAFAGPYMLDARKCLSYLNIEHQGEFPYEMREAMGQRVIGCDVCQAVCPYDRIDAAIVMPTDASPRSNLVNPNLVQWLEMSSTDYRRVAKRTALRRVTRAQLMRNAAIALGNSGRIEAIAPLGRVLSGNASRAVRVHAAWALGRIDASEAVAQLQAALATEDDPEIRDAILAALEPRAASNAT